MNTNVLQQVVTTGVFAASFLVALGGFLMFYRAYREASYDNKRHRAELDMLRASMEKRIYELTDRLLSNEHRWRDVNHLLVSKLENQPQEAPTTPSTSTEFLRSYGIRDLEIDRTLVFVLIPFHNRFQRTFEAIVGACRELGLTCLRGDEHQVTGDLMPHIVRLIAKARVIVAVIDGRNPNVFYELGVAHALDKVTILVSSDVKSAPFDLRSKKLLVAARPETLRKDLITELARTLFSNDSSQLPPPSP